MKYEDLVWTPVEGKDYKQTVINLNDREIKIVKLDEDSFQIYLDSEEIPKEMSLEFLETQLTEEFKVVKKELIQELETQIQSLESYEELIKQEIERVLKLKWNEPNENFKHPYLILDDPNATRKFEIMRLDEDSYLIRGYVKNQTPPANFTEANKKIFLINYAVSRNLNIDLFMSYLEK